MIMKFIDRLEKSKAFWSLLIILPLFFLLRLPSVIEPYWYGDEGIYHVLGDAINNGRILYSEAWDNKPPLLYVTYALFHSDQFMIRFASLISGILATLALFFLSQKLFNNLKASIITTALFTLLFATPYIEGNIANAENFILLPVIVAGFIVYILSQKENMHTLSILAGFLLGIAFLFKIVAFFDFAAFLLFWIIVSLPKKLSPSTVQKLPFKNFLLVIGGFLVPLFITIAWFASQNALPDFIRASFFGNIGYVGWGNNFIIPHGFLILKVILLLLACIFLFIKRHSLSKSALFVFLWLSFALFSAFFSQRPYTHYVLVIIPSFCLLIGLFFATKKRHFQGFLLGSIMLTFIAVMLSFNFYPLHKTFLYYQNAFQFITGTKDVVAYQSFFDRKTPRDYEIASFIRNNTSPEDTIFVWGDSAQIYTLADKLPPGKYTVAYHVTQNKNGIAEVQEQITTQQPKYIIVLAEAPDLPFRLPFYNNPYLINNTLIYEKIN